MRHGTCLTLRMMDLDPFKQFNDAHGRPAYDLVYKRISERILDSIRTENVFARFGGEEFAVIALGILVQEGGILAERLRNLAVRTSCDWNGQRLRITAGIGVAGVPHPGIRQAEKPAAAAHRALYEAKRRGRNRVILDGR